MAAVLDQDACYEALRSKDARFDGRFFVGVATTGVYCRTVCRAKLPKRENCTFYETAAQAEAAGFRPCLQCRPELAPGMAPVDSERTLARKAARLMREQCGDVGDLAQFAAKLGYTDRHLRRAFVEEFGVTPVQYLQTCRLLLAKQLLMSTRIPVAQVATVSGFKSQRRFNDVFKKQYGLVPSEMRRKGGSAGEGAVTLELGYRPPYAWQRILGFLELRAIPGVEAVESGSYVRTARVVHDGRELVGWIRVKPHGSKDVALVTVSSSLLEALPQVIARVRHQFDLDCDPLAIQAGLAEFERVCPGRYLPGTRVPGCFDAFEMCVRAVLGQQISVKGASTLAGRVARAAGKPVQGAPAGLTHVFPSERDIVALGDDVGEALGSLGIVGARVRTIRALAEALSGGALSLDYGADPDGTIEALQALPGIGPWTAHYIAMRAIGYPDAFPATDLGVKKALAPAGPKEVLQIAESWRPWRAYATMSLWCS